MWPKGTQLQWFRRDIFRKQGPAPPHRPGFGQTPLKIFQTSEGFYIGTGFILPDGSEKPYTIESEHFISRSIAQKILEKMTGKKIEENLRTLIRHFLT